MDVAEALDYLHTQRQIMHSDLKARWGGAGWGGGAGAGAGAGHQYVIRVCGWWWGVCLFLLKCGDKLAACFEGTLQQTRPASCPAWLPNTAQAPLHRCPPPACPAPYRRSNVLLSSDLRASLADLGVSQVLLSSARSAAGLSLTYAGERGRGRGSVGWAAAAWVGACLAMRLVAAAPA